MTETSDKQQDISDGGYICIHLLESDFDIDPYRQFTGIGFAHNLICYQCSKDLENLGEHVKKVSVEEFEDRDESRCEGVFGEPEIYERKTDMHFEHQIFAAFSLQGKLLDIIPFDQTWLCILETGQVLELGENNIKEIISVSPEMLQLSDKVTIQISEDKRFLGVVNTFGQDGIILDLSNQKITIQLDRGQYRFEHSHFPIAFFKLEHRTLVIHGTNWNRLDISDPATGELLTKREYQQIEGQKRPEHYLDYFHGRLHISPDNQLVAEDGWIWHPIGSVRVWNLSNWIKNNIWESEDGKSMIYLLWRDYYWNGPMCWIDNHTFAIWGFGNDELELVPAVQIFDIQTGKSKINFAGPQEGKLVFDEYLFSASNKGTDAWDIKTGERLLHEPDLYFLAYNPSTKRFISVFGENQIKLSKLVAS